MWCFEWKISREVTSIPPKDAELLDHSLAGKIDWESFYTEGKRTRPFLRNVPDENLVGYINQGASGKEMRLIWGAASVGTRFIWRRQVSG